MRKKNIVFIVHSLNRVGGGTSSFLDLIETAASLGFNVSVQLTSSKLIYYTRWRFHYPVTVGWFRITRFPFFDSTSRKKEKKNVNKRILWIAQMFSRFGIYFASLFGAQKNLREAHLVFVGEPLPTEALKRLLAAGNARTIYNHAASPDSYLKYNLNPDAESCSKRLQYKKQMAFFDCILFQSQAHAMSYERYIDVSTQKALFLPPTTNERDVLYTATRSSPFDSELFNIVMVGTLCERKSQVDAIAALSVVLADQSELFQRMPLLHLVGGSDKFYEEKLKKLAKRLRVDDYVMFYGHRADYLRYIRYANCLLITSHGEGIPRVLREALLAETAVVCYPLEGVTDYLSHQKDILVTAGRDVHELASFVEKLWQNEEVGREIARSGYEKYLQHYSRVNYAKNLESIVASTAN